MPRAPRGRGLAPARPVQYAAGMAAPQDYFATTAKGLEELLAAELADLGAARVEIGRAGVSFAGPLEVAYRTCLWSRVANRVLLPIAEFRAHTPDALYTGVHSVDWRDHLDPRGTVAVDCSLSQSTLTHSHFAALKTKDAIVDQFRDRSGARPSVDTMHPDVRVNVYIHQDRATLSLDLSGDSLHRRAYRERGHAAPLKETLAAAVLLLADWPRLARERAPFIDPMCGSGTIAIEAAMIATDVAPGRARPYFGFLGWRGHEKEVWSRLLTEADERVVRDAKRLPLIRGFDADFRAVRDALANVERAGLRTRVHIEKRALADCAPPAIPAKGIVVTNPPYGERLGDLATLEPLYAEIGDVLRRRFPGWTGYVLAGNPELAKRIGLRPKRRIVLYNGAIECRLLSFPISETAVREGSTPHWRRA